MTRAEHLQWCKDRALKELEFYPEPETACRNAMASMGSDLRKHPETANHSGIHLGFLMLVSGMPQGREKDSMRAFILGFR